jgi:hypothetical protein
MIDLPSGSQEELDARNSLLKYYYTECMAHGAYILTATIGIFGLIQAFSYIQFQNEFVKQVIFIVAVGGLIGLNIYFIFRSLRWAHFANSILWVKPIDYQKEAKAFECKLSETRLTMMIRLHDACRNSVVKFHDWIYKLSNLRVLPCFIVLGWILVGLFVWLV